VQLEQAFAENESQSPVALRKPRSRSSSQEPARMRKTSSGSASVWGSGSDVRRFSRVCRLSRNSRRACPGRVRNGFRKDDRAIPSRPGRSLASFPRPTRRSRQTSLHRCSWEKSARLIRVGHGFLGEPPLGSGHRLRLSFCDSLYARDFLPTSAEPGLKLEAARRDPERPGRREPQAGNGDSSWAPGRLEPSPTSMYKN
jgi:hypothetical protein